MQTCILFSGIANTGAILPVDYICNDLGNLNQCVLTSGKLLLDAYFNLKQNEIRKRDICKIQNYFETSHYKLQHLFCFRQRIFDTNKPNTTATKPHGCMHLVYDVVEYGALPNFDTVLYENLHIPFAKEAYRSSSRRYNKLYEEMIAGIQAARLLRILGDENDRKMKETVTKDEKVEENEEVSLSYKANLYHVHKRGSHDKSVTYLVPKGQSYSIEVSCNNEMIYPVDKRNKSISNFLNTKLISLNNIYDACTTCDTQDIRDFFMCIKERRNQYRMFFHKHIRLISDYKTNGIPHSYICCDSSINRLRHDWIIDVEENPIHICAILSLHNTLNGVSKIVYIGCETTNLHKAHITNRGIDSPFPVVHYHRARSPISHKTELVFRANMVDNIMQPAFIIPIRRNDPTENLFEKRFFNVPFEFLMRDGFEDMNFEKNIETAVSTDAHARKYLNSDKETRKKLYQILLNSLQKNSNVPQKSKKRKLNNEQNDADASAQKKNK